MEIKNILDEIEALVLEAKRVPFTNKCVIEDDDLIRLIDDLRKTVPQEINEANMLIQEKEQIVAAAQKEANKIVEQAKAYADKLLDENELVKQARVEAERCRTEANKQASELKAGTMKYVDDVFVHLLDDVSATLNVIQDSRKKINQFAGSGVKEKK